MGSKEHEPWFSVVVRPNSSTAVGYIDAIHARSPVIPQIGDTFIWPPRETYRPEGPHFDRQAFKVVDRLIIASIGNDDCPAITRVEVIVDPVEIPDWKLESA